MPYASAQRNEELCAKRMSLIDKYRINRDGAKNAKEDAKKQNDGWRGVTLPTSRLDLRPPLHLLRLDRKSRRAGVKDGYAKSENLATSGDGAAKGAGRQIPRFCVGTHP
jgi:hypothetical protein